MSQFLKSSLPEPPFCECGCGEKTAIIKRNTTKDNRVKGGYSRFICGHNKVGKHNPRWKGGRQINSQGYVLLWNPTHPKSDAHGYIREHVMFVEIAMGKPLPSQVVVHHHTPKQLVVCENQGYHLLLHQRMRAHKACGHADWRKCQFCKQHDSVDHLVIYKKSKSTDIFHRDCRNKHRRSKSLAERENFHAEI